MCSAGPGKDSLQGPILQGTMSDDVIQVVVEILLTRQARLSSVLGDLPVNQSSGEYDLIPFDLAEVCCDGVIKDVSKCLDWSSNSILFAWSCEIH
jgi:hypothetical protein